MKQSASHKTATTMMSILLVLSMVVSVFWAASMPLMNAKSSMTAPATMQYSVSSTNMPDMIDMPEKCPASSDKAVGHCTTCAFISNMVGIAPSIIASIDVGQKESYPLHHGRLKGIPNNVDLSPPQIS